MALELATAIVRVKIDRANLNAEIRAAREAIRKGLSGIKVKVDIDARHAASSGRNAGKAAGKAAQEEISKALSRAYSQSGGGMIRRTGMTVSGRGPEGARFFSQPDPKRLGGPSGGGGGNRGGGRIPPSSGVPPSGGRGFGGVPLQPNMFGGFGKGAKNFGAGALFGVSPGAAVATAFGGVPGAAGYGMAKAGTSAVREFASYEHAFKRVEIIQEEAGATEKQIEKLEKQARDLGRSTVFSALQAAQAMVVLTQKGFDANEVYSQMPNVLNLAAAGQLEIAAAAGIVASAQKQFGMDSKKTSQIVDVLAKASLNSSTDVYELGHSLSYAGQIADISGKSLQETTAIIMMLRDAGMEASRAGTGAARVMTRLADPKVIAKFKDIGVAVVGVNGEFRALADIVDDTNAAMKNMSGPEQLAFTKGAFGDRGGPAFGSLLNQGGDALRENTELLEGFAGTAERVANKTMDDLTGSTILLVDALKELGLTFGETFGGTMRTTVDTIKRGLIDIDNAVDAVENFVGEVSGRKNARLKAEGENLDAKSKEAFKRAMIDESAPIAEQIQSIDTLRAKNDAARKNTIVYSEQEDLRLENMELSKKRRSLVHRQETKQKSLEAAKLLTSPEVQSATKREELGNRIGSINAGSVFTNQLKSEATKAVDGLKSLLGGEPGKPNPVEKAFGGLAIAAPQIIAGLITGNPALGAAGTIRAASNFQSQTFGIQEMANGIQASLSSKDSAQEDIKKKTADIAKSNQGILSTLQKADNRARYS